MDFTNFDTPPDQAIRHDFSQRDFASVEKEFIEIFDKLTRKSHYYISVEIDGCKGGWETIRKSRAFMRGIF